MRSRQLIMHIGQQTAMGPTQPASQQIPGVRSPKLKWSGREADNSFAFIAGVKNGALRTLPPYAFMACTGTTLSFVLRKDYSMQHFCPSFLLHAAERLLKKTIPTYFGPRFKPTGSVFKSR
jgi:hypothetical protein